MKKLFLPLALFAVQIFQACGGSGRPASSQVDTLDLTASAVVLPDDMFKKPMSIFATDNRLVVLNTSAVDTFVDLFTLSGEPVASMLTKGNGPGETPYIYSATIDAGNGRLLLALKTGQISALDLSDQVSGPRLSNLFTYTPDSLPGSDTLDVVFANYLLADGSVLAGLQDPLHPFALIAPDGSFSRYAGQPIPLSDFGEGFPTYARYNFCTPNGAVSPDGRHFVSTFGSADMITFANLTPDSLQVITDYVAPPKGIEITLHDGWSSFQMTEDFMTNYTTVPALSNKHAYVQYVGLPQGEFLQLNDRMQKGEIPATANLRVYDFDGTLRRVLHIDALPRSIAVSPDDSALYVLTETVDGYSCLKYDLPPLD